MSRDDLSQVLAIEKVSFPLPFSQNLFHMELDLNIAHMLVAHEGEAILGYLDFWHVDRELHVINIAVDPKLRGQGVGAQLMQYMLDYAKKQKAELIYLDVRESNESAIKLYRNFACLVVV